MITTNQIPPYPCLQFHNPLLLRRDPALLPPKFEASQGPARSRLQKCDTGFLDCETFPECFVPRPEIEAADARLEDQRLRDKFGQDAFFAMKFGPDEICSALRLEVDDVWEEDA